MQAARASLQSLWLCVILLMAGGLGLGKQSQQGGAGSLQKSGNTYYVDSTLGDDNHNGTSLSTAWKTLAKINATFFSPGDRILFKSGSTWTGQLWPKGSGTEGRPILIDKYGGEAEAGD